MSTPGMELNSGIVVLGMHRSGTSLTAELVHGWGAYGNERSMIEGDGWNPRGYWEYRPLVEFNDRLLQAVESSWMLPPGEEEQSRLVLLAQEPTYRTQALGLLQQMQTRRRPWFWKDPRLTLLLPFWKQLWGDVTYLVPVREPADLAASLQQRNGLSLTTSLLIWQRYMSAILLDRDITSAALFISYEKMLENGISECQRLCHFLDRRFGIRAPDPDWRPEIMAQAIAPELRANRSGISFSQNLLATADQKNLHCTLQLRAQGLTPEFDAVFDLPASWRDCLILETSPHWRHDSCNFFQVFWRASDLPYSETQSRSLALRAGNLRQTLRIALPPVPAEGVTALRLDFGPRPGFLNVHEIVVADVAGNIVWAWDGDPESIQTLSRNQLSLCDLQISDQDCMLQLEGEDPWMEVVLTPSQSFTLQDGGVVVLDCTHLSPGALFARLLEWVSSGTRALSAADFR